MKLVDAEGYDVVIGDPLIKRALPGWKGYFPQSSSLCNLGFSVLFELR